MRKIAKLSIYFVVVSLFSCLIYSEAYPAGQLPSGVKPLSYQIQLKIDPKKDTFSGTVRINLEFEKSMRSFWMHGNNLNVSSVFLELRDHKTLKGTYRQVSQDGVVQITLPNEIAAQKATLILSYSAKLSNQLSGLYKVTVNKTSYAFTQFEPIAARECFPSFDEPRFKTPFDVELIVPKNDVAVANAPLVSESRQPDGQKLVRFAQTKPLPTYLVAFAVGPFEVVEANPIPVNTVRNVAVPFRAVAAKGMGKQLKYAMEHTPHILALLENYFGIPYPYEKLDIIAVPDFSAGAMENAGAITFRDALLIIDEKSAPASQKESFTEVMAHELAHQWFGNLVTMPWWNDAWLNEAFATWMGYRIAGAYNPKSNSDLNLLDWVHGTMQQDSLLSARSIKQPVLTYHDIYNSFDSITYAKGAGVLSMFESYLGKDVFQKSIHYHLNRFAWGNATAHDFMESLSKVSKQNIKDSFLSFIEQPGIPFIKTYSQCEATKASLELTQSRYLPIGSSDNEPKSWQIPFCYKHGIGNQNTTECLLMKPGSLHWQFNGPCPGWIMFNANAAGYYRWTVPAEEITLLTKKHLAKLNAREQLDLANNIEAGFQNGSFSAGTVLNLFPLFALIENRFVASGPLPTLYWIKDYSLSAALLPAFQKYVSDAYTGIQEKLASNPNILATEEGERLQIKIDSIFANLVKDENVRARLKKEGERYIQNLVKKKPTQKTELAFVSVPVWAEETPRSTESLRRLLAKTFDPMQRIVLIKAIASGAAKQDPAPVYRLLLSDDLRRGEIMSLLYNLMNDSKNREKHWNWIKKNYQALASIIPDKKKASLPFLVSGFCSAQKAQEVKDFFETKIANLPGGPRYLKESLEQISNCQNLVTAQRSHVEAFFLKQP